MALSVSLQLVVENNLLPVVLPRLRDATGVTGVQEEERTGDKNVTIPPGLFRIDCRIMFFVVVAGRLKLVTWNGEAFSKDPNRDQNSD